MIEVFSSGIRLSTATMLAGLGGYLSGITGQLNIAIEGMMLLGAYFALMTAYFSGSVIVGLIAAIVAGALTGLVLSISTVRLRANVFVLGITLNILASGLTALLLGVQFDVQGSFSDPSIGRIPNVSIPLIHDIPWIGAIIGRANLLTYTAFALFVAMRWVVNRTALGLHIRVSGDAPDALTAAGISSDRTRIGAQVAGGALCGMSGAYLSLGQLTLFSEDMSAGRGFLALAAVIFAGRHLKRLLAICIGFGVLEAWSIDIQGGALPPPIAQMVPYAATLIALIAVSVRDRTSRERTDGDATPVPKLASPATADLKPDPVEARSSWTSSER